MEILERKLHLSQGTIIVVHIHNTIILGEFFFSTLLVLARRVTNIFSVMRTLQGNEAMTSHYSICLLCPLRSQRSHVHSKENQVTKSEIKPLSNINNTKDPVFLEF